MSMQKCGEAYFCEGCPLAGDATGPLIGVQASEGPIMHTSFGVTSEVVRAGVVRDESYRPSEPIEMPEGLPAEFYTDAIKRCAEPENYVIEGRKRLFREREPARVEAVCPALGHLAIKKWPALLSYLRSAFGVQSSRR